MLLVDRKVSLPGDFDIQVAYIYPIAIASAAVEMSDDEEVSYFTFILWYEVLFIQMEQGSNLESSASEKDSLTTQAGLPTTAFQVQK